MRNDTGVTEGSEISIHYDPMIAKLVTHAPTRAVLALVRDVFALQLIERDLGWYLTRRRLGVQRARAVPRTLDALLARLRPHAVDLVQAFGYEQGHLRAAIASGAEELRQEESRRG